jgi:type II secretory pathway pseudopilin PulG
MTLVEVIIALVVLTTAMLAVVTTITSALLLSETNRQFKMAVFDTQSVVDQIAGTPYEEICDADSNYAAGPRFPQGMYYLDEATAQMRFQPIHYPSGTYLAPSPNPYVKLNLLGTDPQAEQKIYIFYFSDETRQQYFHTSVRDRNLDPRRSDYSPLPDLLSINWTPGYKPWLPLDRPAGSPATVYDLKNPPDPLYMVVRCVWNGPRQQEMTYEVPFLVTNLLDSGEE